MERDELFEEAARIIVENKMASASFLQRKLVLGYNRANRIIDQLENYSVIGEFNGTKPREVMFHSLEDLNEFLEKIK
jgi:DNA segregation ATPase FtsK/SpoIIIE, S-DNA-T family